ncbi:unnamed protein product, partial [Ixodes hexagonus]
FLCRLQETQLELEEFQASSRDLEVELETQLKHYESTDRELRSLLGRVQSENDALQEKLSQVQRESTRQVSDLQVQLADVTASREEMHRYIRELEQSNDDLERAKRATVASLEEFESKLNLAIERNAFLENELDEKEALGFMVQRLKDETRDLKQELMIQQTVHKEEQTPFADNATSGLAKLEAAYKARKEAQAAAAAGATPNVATPTTRGSSGATDSNRIATENGGSSSSKLSSNGAAGTGIPGCQTPLTPSARVSALNIVGDLLRKVGVSTLCLCRRVRSSLAVDVNALVSADDPARRRSDSAPASYAYATRPLVGKAVRLSRFRGVPTVAQNVCVNPKALVGCFCNAASGLVRLLTLESKLASCRNFVKSPQREDMEGLGAIPGVAAAG